jgi:hypothetical protein
MDGLDAVFENFNSQRTKTLAQRFTGSYRAIVVETNDPLVMFRIRFKCPELHDFDLLPQDCPWAVPSPEMGNFRSGRWTHPCIGDWVMIQFEKNHPYGPIWAGFATPTRRKTQVYASIYGVTPVPVDESSNATSAPNDYTKTYLPQDNRPMSHGWSDRYGNLDVTNSVGYFPSQHAAKPPPPDVDNLTASNFSTSQSKPVSNSPDSKWMARLTKYGNMLLQSDVGYEWKQSGNTGEFQGDFANDEQWEINRWKYWQRVIHEDAPSGRDQRRMMLMTRYGHRVEMRDVGWIHTRAGEFDSQKVITSSTKDERWIKSRTKGGHIIEQIDIGFDEINDEFVKRLVVDEVSAPTPLDKEDKFGKDARQIRIVARTGRKIVLDDRTSNTTNADSPSLPNDQIGYGILIKGRATPGARNNYTGASGNPIGYFFEINEKPGQNRTIWGSPLGQVIEINDNSESMVFCSKLPALPAKCQFLSGNEFLAQSAFDLAPETNTHHLIIDHENEVVRLKSRAGHGASPLAPKRGGAASGTNAGLEISDAPAANPWVELVDHDDRGLWFSRENKLTIWRSKPGTNMFVWMDEKGKQVVIKNDESGTIQIVCGGNVQIKAAKNVNIQGGDLVTLKASQAINMQVDGARYQFGPAGLSTNMNILANSVFALFPQIQDGDGGPPGSPSGSGASVSNIREISTPASKPSNRL